MKPARRRLLQGTAVLALPAPAWAASSAAPKVLRLASESETGFDPARVGDVRSLRITSHVFETLLEFDPLARPVKLRPRTAQAMPEPSADFRTWTVRLKPGIHFTPDPAFAATTRGAPRELVATDVAYSLKRLADPATRSPGWSAAEQVGLSGLAALRREAVEQKKPFDYDRPIPGLQVLDRHTLRFVLDAGRPRFPQWLASASTATVAREVIEAHGELSMQHPVGTGPFRLVEWRRSSRIVLERNPHYRSVLYDAEPAADDLEGQAILARLRGRRLPMVDRVEIDIIDEKQPMWLAFLNGDHDWVELPDGFLPVALPGGRLAPHLRRRGIRADSAVLPSTYYTMFNMEHPLVGGYTPERVALRRAISLATDTGREIRTLRKNMAIPAQSPVAPNLTGYDPAFKSEMSTYDPARARALLDLYGWTDRNGDGWREQPDGKPLVLQIATQPDQTSRDLDELRQKNLQAVGIRVEFKPAKWPENLKAGRAGKLQVWALASLASAPDGQDIFARYYGPQSGLQNIARFKLPELDRIYDQMSRLPDGPERLALFEQAKKLVVAYMPYKLGVHRYVADLMTDRVVGYRRPLFWLNWYHLVDVLPGGDSPA